MPNGNKESLEDTIDAEIWYQQAVREAWQWPVAIVFGLSVGAYAFSFFDKPRAVCLFGLGGFYLIYRHLYKFTVRFFEKAYASRDQGTGAILSAKLYYFMMGVIAALLEIFSNIVVRLAGDPDPRAVVTAFLAFVPLVLGMFARDPANPNLAGKALKFMWSFEFCRSIILFLCGLWGATSFHAATTILGVPAPDRIQGIPVFLPIWLLSDERQAAAWDLFTEMGSKEFYAIFLVLPLWLLLSKLFHWGRGLFQKSWRGHQLIGPRSAYIAIGLVLLSGTVAARNNDLLWITGKLYFQVLGKGHPIDAKLYACREQFYTTNGMAGGIPCFQTANTEWEAEIERLNGVILANMSERSSTAKKAAFLNNIQMWKAERTRKLKLIEQELSGRADKDLRLVEERTETARRRAVDYLQRLLRP